MKEELKKVELFASALPSEYSESKKKMLDAIEEIKRCIEIKELYESL